jgi:hypothetical protein
MIKIHVAYNATNECWEVWAGSGRTYVGKSRLEAIEAFMARLPADTPVRVVYPS